MESWLKTPILFLAFKTPSIQRFQFMNLQHQKTQAARPYLLLQVKKGRGKDIKWPSQGDMVSQRKNRKERTERICQKFAQQASQPVTDATWAPSRISHSEGACPVF